MGTWQTGIRSTCCPPAPARQGLEGRKEYSRNLGLYIWKAPLGNKPPHSLMQEMKRDGSRISRWRARAGSCSSWTPEPELFLLGLIFLFRPQNTGVEDLSCSEASGPQRDTPGSSSQACPWKSINNHNSEALAACHVPGTPEALVRIHRSVQSSRHPCSAGFRHQPWALQRRKA